MYNTELICTYNTDDIFEPTDELTEYDKEFVRDVIYRQELLNIFGLEEYESTRLDDAFHKLYERIKDYKPLQEIMVKLASEIMCEDKEVGMIILYSYDFMYLTHLCICELLNFENISDDNLNNLKKIIKF